MTGGGPVAITAEQFAAIYRTGMTASEFARKAGVSITAALNAFRRNGAPVRPRGRPLGPEPNERIAHRHQDFIYAVRAGFCPMQIARDRGISRQAVHQLIKNLSDRGLLEAV